MRTKIIFYSATSKKMGMYVVQGLNFCSNIVLGKKKVLFIFSIKVIFVKKLQNEWVGRKT